jgi:hypothetical protein
MQPPVRNDRSSTEPPNCADGSLPVTLMILIHINISGTDDYFKRMRSGSGFIFPPRLRMDKKPGTSAKFRTAPIGAGRRIPFDTEKTA